METVSSALYPYRNVLGILASICSLIQHISGVIVCCHVCENKTTLGTSSNVFIGNLIVAFLELKFAAIINDNITYYLYLACIMLQSTYLSAYWYYSQNKSGEVYVPLSYAGLIVGLAYGYAAYEDPDKLRFRFGLILTLVLIVVLAYPLQNLKYIIQEEDASSIPFPVISASALVSVMWLLYGLAVKNNFLMIQCASCFAVCAFQVVLYVKYPKKREE